MYPINLIKSKNCILLFHSISSKNIFRNTLNSIKKIYNFVSLEEIELYFYENMNLKNCCHICFDDGTKSIYDKAFPILKEMKIPASLFVSPKMINEESNYWFQELNDIQNQLNSSEIKKTISEFFQCEYNQIKTYSVLNLFRSMKIKDILQILHLLKNKYHISIDQKFNMTKENLKEIHESRLISIGAHTLNHPILKNESNKYAEKEIIESINQLSRMLDTDINYFAYPNGKNGLDYNKREKDILAKKDIKLSFSTENNYFSKDMNPLNIPRSGFSGTNIENRFYILSKLLIIPIWDDILWLRFKGKKRELDERNRIKKLNIF
jgi:peptidoglycan/xylan/chitin deacetylase (PgdA/CDA1 family)